MKKFIKQLFCKHVFKRYWMSYGNRFLHFNKWYSDDWEIEHCKKCGKEKRVKHTNAKRHKSITL